MGEQDTNSFLQASARKIQYGPLTSLAIAMQDKTAAPACFQQKGQALANKNRSLACLERNHP